MKVKIGPYRDWIGPYQIAEKIFFWYPKTKDELGMETEAEFIHKFGEWLAEDRHGNDSWLMKLCNWIHSKKNRKVKIHIDRWDSWNAHNTASLILHPLFKQLQETKHGSGFVDDEDVPEELRSTAPGAWDGISEDERINMGYNDNNFHKRYEWMLSEVIWALEQDNAEWEEQFWITHPKLDMKEYPEDEGKQTIPVRWEIKGEVDWDGRQKYQDRITNGFRLMGKYWQTFWD